MEFKDFNIEILAKRGDNFDIRIVSQASGEMPATISLQHSVDDLLSMFHSSSTNVRSASGNRAMEFPVEGKKLSSTEVGRVLFESLFSAPETSRALAECMTDAKANNAGIRFKLTMNTQDDAVADLARLPWELMHDHSKYKYFGLRPDSPIVRYLEVPKPFEVHKFELPLRILVVSANPHNDLALDKERDNLVQALGSDENIELDFIELASIQKIASKLANAKAAGKSFHVLHYMGHGDFHNGKGVLLLHKEDGGVDYVDSEAFNTALQASGSIRMVFLNACNTAQSGGQEGEDPFAGVASALVFEGVPAVVAMQRPIPDRAAIIMAKNFYPNIAKGWPVDAAVSEGRRQVFFDDRDTMDWAIPVLFMRAPNGVLFDIAEKPADLQPIPVPVVEKPIEASVQLPDSNTVRSAPPPPQKPPVEKARKKIEPASAAPFSAEQKSAVKKWGPFAAIGVLGILAGVFIIPMLTGPAEPARVELQMPPSVEMGKSIEAQFELIDEKRNFISGKSLSGYEVKWTLSDESMAEVSAQAVTPESQALTASILGLKAPASPTQKLTVTATLANFENLSESATIEVKLSQQAKEQFTEAFRKARAEFENPSVENSKVAATYQELMTSWGWIGGYLNEIKALNSEEKVAVKSLTQDAKQLKEADAAFKAAKDQTAGAEASISDAEEVWSSFINTYGNLRQSPALEEASANLLGLEEIKKNNAWVKTLLTCSNASFTGSKCASSQLEFNSGDAVKMSVVYTTPRTMSGTDKLTFEIQTVEPDGAVTTVKTINTSNESGRSADRNWWNSFTLTDAKPHRIKVTNNKGHIVWLEELTVN